jgi:ubiquinone/menaquinone biosynthesis C-methylase UbiE
MKLTRDAQRPIRYFFDEVLPPVIRDSRLFLVFLRIVFGSRYRAVADFRSQFSQMSDTAVARVYSDTQRFELKTSTDINKRTMTRIQGICGGRTVVDIGCGTGGVLDSIDPRSYIGIDFVASESWASLKRPGVEFLVAPADQTQLPSQVAEVVLCCHVLEHVRDPKAVLGEVRRLGSHFAIIALPRERPYRAGFNLHVHFFTYEWQVQELLRPIFGDVVVEKVDGDFLAVVPLVSEQIK